MEKIYLYIFAALVSLASMITPIVPLMLTVGLLIAVDTVFGVWSAMKRNEKVTSKGLSRLIAKMCVYQTVVVTLFFIETHIMGSLLPLVKLGAMGIVFVEILSVLENAGFIVGKPVFNFLIQKLSSKSRKFGEEE